ncbi:hypothetical protein AB0C50_22085 [Micromonospora taraxaci]|uniref:hypothetical protein n=1 Tax=Micromonospora taraxaci TaxID=1316803 RepID=UPI0033CBCACE
MVYVSPPELITPNNEEADVPKVIRMPSPDVVPERTKRRGFLEEMFLLYRAAGSPALREIEEWIRQNDELKGTASAETIRRILHGHVPRADTPSRRSRWRSTPGRT